MHAIILDRNKQYMIKENAVLKVDILNANINDIVYIDKILFLNYENKISIGTPFVDGKKIALKVMSHIKSKKILVLKFKRRKNYLKRHGHRQNYTLLKFLHIEDNK